MERRRSGIVIVSNRLPVHRVRRGGAPAWETSPGGLVSALTPILQQRPSTWIGWTGRAGTAPAPFRHEGIDNHPVPLSRREVETYYEGFCNRTLWPLYHDAMRPPEFHRSWWRPYETVNERFADAAAKVAAKNGLVWVHDYHLQLVPRMLRERRPDLRIGFFLHIPFPPQELFSQLPWRTRTVEGILGADVVGFQTRQGARNFADLARRFAGVGGSGGRLQVEGRLVRVSSFPVSIDFAKYDGLARSDAVRERAEQYRERVGRQRRILLGVDRLDYTKGIDIRLRAYEELLETGRLDAQRCVLVQVAVPSREQVGEYQVQRSVIEESVGRINGEFGQLGRTPIHYLHRSLPAEELVALYVAADVLLCTPLRDGMNLVAKEYVASRVDDTGVLVLSEFTGSARELRTATIVNPHDIDGVVDAIGRALAMTEAEQKRAMAPMRRRVKQYDVHHWAGRFLEALRR